MAIQNEQDTKTKRDERKNKENHNRPIAKNRKDEKKRNTTRL